ncbi:MAG: PLDc_N domain-containing protein [Maritimibacter sp.]|nr:PLDc_N domain-containing protein [Maritimibacter sp.]
MEIVTTGIGGTIVLALDIYAIYSILTSRNSAGAKILWTILVLLLPILGFIIWLLAGPRSTAATI